MDLAEDLATDTLVLPVVLGEPIVKAGVVEKTRLISLKEYQLPDDIGGKTHIHSLVGYGL